MGWLIVRHSFVLLFRNLGDALKVSIGPNLIAIALTLALAVALGLPLDLAAAVGSNPQAVGRVAMGSGGPLVAFALGSVAILMATSAWVAVSWHRFVLLEEYPGLLPALSGNRLVAYVLRTLLLVVVVILVAVPLGLVLGLFAFLLTGMNSGGAMTAAALLVGLAFGTVLYAIWLRLSLILPASALDTPMSLGDSWRQTARLSGAIFTAVVILVGLSIVVSYLLATILGQGLPGALANIVVNWITVMVSVSVMTTLYGHLVEGRPID